MITMFLYSPPLKRYKYKIPPLKIYKYKIPLTNNNSAKDASEQKRIVWNTNLNFLTISSSCKPSLFDELPPMLLLRAVGLAVGNGASSQLLTSFYSEKRVHSFIKLDQIGRKVLRITSVTVYGISSCHQTDILANDKYLTKGDGNLIMGWSWTNQHRMIWWSCISAEIGTTATWSCGRSPPRSTNIAASNSAAFELKTDWIAHIKSC